MFKKHIKYNLQFISEIPDIILSPMMEREIADPHSGDCLDEAADFRPRPWLYLTMNMRYKTEASIFPHRH